MKSLKSISQSWLSAGLSVAVISAGGILLLHEPLYGTTNDLDFLNIICWLTLVFALPSALLNWVYDKRGYEKSQRQWMCSPRSFLGRLGYVLSGSTALWILIALGFWLTFFVINGLFSLGQAAWQT